MPDYIGNYAYRGRAEKLFVEGEKEKWLDEMTRRYHLVTQHSLSAEQRRAWSNSYDALRGAFEHMPSAYGKLQLVFEYVMPLCKPGAVNSESFVDPGVRADVLLLSRDTVAVLEFKDRSEVYPGVERQARKYQRRLQRWHTVSIGMNKKTLLIFTLASGIHSGGYRLGICSPENMAEAIRKVFPASFRGMADARLKRWLASEWEVRERYRR